MTKTLRQGVLALIHSAVSGEAKTLPEGFDLEAAIPLIQKHKINNLIYYGAKNCGIDASSPVMKNLFLVTYQAMCADERQREQLSKLFAAFDANGIEYMPVKGVLLKALYPKPDMRIMGDADILIRLEQYEKIRPIMESLGYTEKLESDHELIWTHPSLYLELHKRLIPSYNYDYAAYYGDGWQLGHPSTENPCRYEMTDEDQMIYLFTHFAKHYRDGGIGIRHLLDLYLYRKAKPNMDIAYLERELKKLQLDVFHAHIVKTMDVWFDGASADEMTDTITDFLFGSGSFGAKVTQRVARGVRNKSKNGGGAKQVRARFWLRVIFLPYGQMCTKYPVLKKLPILLPVMWVVRWFQTLLKGKPAIDEQRNRAHLLTEDKLDAWESQMHAVGLGFHFEENEQ
ncbi:MAG: nucleotidyltransferase family protein [Oscillospiraceae bacterium]|nr:nucleotidyltransferase family protein [Oscillospiraceae bacterium]